MGGSKKKSKQLKGGPGNGTSAGGAGTSNGKKPEEGSATSESSQLEIDLTAPLLNGQMKLDKLQLDRYFDKLFTIPNFQDVLSKKDMLNLRLVCRDWKNSMDNFWKTFDEPVPNFSSYKSILASPSTISLAYHRKIYARKTFLIPKLDHSSKAEKFLKRTENFKGNPFISRRASLWYAFEEGPDITYWSKIVAILKRFGNKIHTVHFFYRSESTTAEMLIRVKECLELLPQLTTLLLCIVSVHEEENGPLPILGLPPMPMLQRISISFARAPLHHPFSVYFDQLVVLKTRGEKDFMDWFDPEVHSTFPKLKRLAVFVNDAQALFKLHCLTGPLREIEIQSNDPTIHPIVYFHIAKRFMKTLCAFKIHEALDCSVEVKDMKTFGLKLRAQIDLPELKTLCISILKCGRGYGPVLGILTQLSHPPEYLEVMMGKCCSGISHTGTARGTTQDLAKNNNLQIHDCRENMYTSNIWGLWPTLQQIYLWNGPVPGVDKLGEGVFTRAKFEFVGNKKTQQTKFK